MLDPATGNLINKGNGKLVATKETMESLSDYEIAQEIAKKKVLKHQMEAIVNLEFLEINTFIDETGEFLK